jgi:P-type Ca2+ transporter type 2C
VMITGDNELTAKAIAKELGLDGPSANGKDLEKTGDLQAMVSKTDIYARVNPEHKMRIVEALQAQGHIVAMTGDGVNDAPAIKKADIGIAMGITGTDVAKESSKMVLLDDNFVSIVNAVEEGRGIYDNIRKFVYYLLSCNMGEFITIFTAVMIFYTWPLGALQILWMNLMTDSLPALALGVDPISHDIMDRKPRKSTERIINGKSMARMLSLAAVMTCVSLVIYRELLPKGYALASTAVFSVLVVMQLLLAISSRSESSIFSRESIENRYLLLAVAGSFILQLAVIYTPLAAIFESVPLSGADWVLILLGSSSLILVEEVRKFLARKAGV